MRINFNLVNRFIILVVLCLFVFQFASAQNATAPSARQIAAKVDEYMKKIETIKHCIKDARVDFCFVVPCPLSRFLLSYLTA